MRSLDFDSVPDPAIGSLDKALGPGERWISVHPNGPGSKGHPVLIQEHPDGTARIIGGAGGKLNHMRLRGIKPGSDYKASLAEKHKDRQVAKKQQVARDKELGVHEAKQAERGKLREAMAGTRKSFIQSVASLAGWDQKELEFDEAKHAGLSPDAAGKARKDHEKQLFKRAKETVEINRKALLDDHDARVASGLGELPMTSPDADSLSAADLDPMPERSPGLGFSADYKKRAEGNGLTKDGAAEELAGMPGAEAEDPEAAAKKAEKKSIADKAGAELEKFRQNNPDSGSPSPKVLADAKKAADLVKAMKKLKMAEQQAKTASLAIDNATLVESKSHIIEVSDADVEQAARKQMEDDLRTIGARAFLSEVGKAGGDSALGGHVAAGSFNALNAFAQAVGGDSLIDRSVVDVLGVSVAAQVLARRIAKDYEAGDLDRIRQGAEAFHVHSQGEIEKKAIATAKEYHDAAAAIELPDASTGLDLMYAQELNAKRRDAIGAAKKVLGHALGEMEANANLVSALNSPSSKGAEVNLGKVSAESALTQLRAIGLQKGDYTLDKVGDALVATVTADGLDRLAKPIDRDGMARIKRNLDIINGKHDEAGWLPKGFADRPDLAMSAEPGVAERLAEPFSPGDNLVKSMKNYIGGRAADGDAPSDILADIQSQDFIQKAGGDAKAFRAALDEVAPLKDDAGKMRPIETLDGRFRGYADDFVLARHGIKRFPIHRQEFDLDQKSVDALHRALTETPEGVAAFKPVGDLTAKERNGLRKWFYANVAKEDPDAAEKRKALEDHQANEPEKEFVDMFGETSTNPEWSAWKTKRDDLAQAHNAAGLNWNKYIAVMGSPVKAIAAVQDLVRSQTLKSFVVAHNKLHQENPLKIGKTVIAGNLNHLDAVDPSAREKRIADQRALADSLRERTGGKYASGSVSDKIGAAKESKAAFEQSQMGFFSTEELPQQSADTPLAADERYTIGHAAEQKIAGMMSVVGKNFKPGQPTKLWQPSMGSYDAKGNKKPDFARQRLIKMLTENKRVMAAFGTGSGKSALQLGGFTHLYGLGKVRKGIIIAPSIVVGQFGGEALRYLDPGKFKWHAEPGASFEERLAAYKDPDTHFSVVTHQSFRDDMLHLGADHAGIGKAEMAEKLNAMSEDDQAAWSKAIMEKEGFNFDYMTTDESQYTLNRAGKENSRLANVVDAFSRHADYYMPSSGDPVKSDASELYDVFRKLDPARYTDRSEFMRKYGGDAVSSKDALKREMARYFYPSKIDPDVAAEKRTINVSLNDQQHAALKSMDKDLAKARLDRIAGKVDVKVMRRLSPTSFDGVPEEKHADVAKSLQSSIGMLKQAATQRIIDQHPQGAKLDEAINQANERKGKPGIIFARNLAVVDQIRERLEKAGHRVVTLTGADSAKDKDKKRLMFNPESGDRQADVMVLSDAGATGLNLQSGTWCMQYDTPMTAMVHAQRQGRVFRTGQKNDVELLDLVADHKFERKARDRLLKKYELRELTTSPMEMLDDSPDNLAYYLHAQKVTNAEQQAS